jgi:hypothetical protein
MIRGNGSKAAGAVKISARRAERAAIFSAARQSTSNPPAIRQQSIDSTQCIFWHAVCTVETEIMPWRNRGFDDTYCTRRGVAWPIRQTR